MGAKAPAKLRLRRGVRLFKCDLCGRHLMSFAALKSHQRSIHSKALKSIQTTLKSQSKSKLTAVRDPSSQKFKQEAMSNTAVVKMQKLSPHEMSNMSRTTSSATKCSEDAVPESTKQGPVEEKAKRKIEFECPVCEKMFSVYFSALKHIQKYHCVNNKGVVVSPTSPDLVKPIHTERCLECGIKLTLTQDHICTNEKVLELDEMGFATNYTCSGCHKEFETMKLFDLHVSGMHGDGVHSLFFPTKAEFMDWKQHMETQTNVKYSILGRFVHKYVYRCTYLPPTDNSKENSTALFCPSSMVIQEFTKGVQVHFYKHHFGHAHNEYILEDKYKSYNIPLMRKRIRYVINVPKTEDTESYIEFKSLMERLVHDAAQLTLPKLKVLMDKALDMSNFLAEHKPTAPVESKEKKSIVLMSKANSKNVTEEQIAKALENLKTTNLVKRKISDDIKPVEKITTVKRPRNESVLTQSTDAKLPTEENSSPTPRIIRSFSLANRPDIDKALKEISNDNYTENVKQEPKKNVNETKVKDVTKERDVMKEKDVTKEIDVMKEKDVTKERNVMKEKDVTKERNVMKEKDVTKERNVIQEKDVTKERDVMKDKDVTKDKKIVKSIVKHKPQSFNDTYKDFVHKNWSMKPSAPPKKRVDANIDKQPAKNKFKTKIGQFKPSTSPKNQLVNTIPVTDSEMSKSKRNGLSNVKIEKYEVKEQENGYNILILKI